MMKPHDIAVLDEQIDAINDELSDKRDALRSARRDENSIVEAEIEAEIDALKDQRADLKSDRRQVKREYERMPGQVIRRFVALIVDENAAREYFEAEFEDQAGAIIVGGRKPDEALDIALRRMAREAHVIFDFSHVPLIGGWLERHDDDLFEWALPAIAQLGRTVFETWRAGRQ